MEWEENDTIVVERFEVISYSIRVVKFKTLVVSDLWFFKLVVLNKVNQLILFDYI
jgi:hypothetical protein